MLFRFLAWTEVSGDPGVSGTTGWASRGELGERLPHQAPRCSRAIVCLHSGHELRHQINGLGDQRHRLSVRPALEVGDFQQGSGQQPPLRGVGLHCQALCWRGGAGTRLPLCPPHSSDFPFKIIPEFQATPGPPLWLLWAMGLLLP